MNIQIINTGKSAIAEITGEGILISTVQDALDIMADSGYMGAGSMLLYEENLMPAFFDLSSGLAGEILQKYSNYKVRLAIVGDFSKYTSKSLRDFIFESNKHGRVIFTSSRDEAIQKLSPGN
jgi:hypothetical protein